MAKKRKTRPRTMDLMPDEEDFDYVRDKMQHEEPEHREAPVSLKAPKVAVDWKGDSAYREGQVVTIAELQLEGTIVNCVGKDLMVLDASGVMHCVKEHEVYAAQNIA